MKRWRVDARSLHAATLTPPLSKSDAQRAQVLGWLTGQRVSLGDEAALPADVRVMRAGLEALGPLRANAGEARIDCADGGAPFRILVALAVGAVAEGARVTFSGTARLAQRPHDAHFAALRETFGREVLQPTPETLWPLQVSSAGPVARRVIRLDASESSQYATGLLFAAASRVIDDGLSWTLEFTGEVASRGYLELTLSWLHRAGFKVATDGDRVTLGPRSGASTLPAIPGDWSSLGYLLLAGWSTASPVARIDLDAAHPDRAVWRLLGSVGLDVGLGVGTDAETTAFVRGTPRQGLTASGHECPDLLPTLAALACVLPSPSTLEDTDILIGKESNRQEAILELVRAAGGEARLSGTSIRIVPPEKRPTELRLDSRGDHRLAMTAATLAVMTRATLLLSDPECVEKSFPTFWTELEKLGVKLSVD